MQCKYHRKNKVHCFFEYTGDIRIIALVEEYSHTAPTHPSVMKLHMRLLVEKQKQPNLWQNKVHVDSQKINNNGHEA